MLEILTTSPVCGACTKFPPPMYRPTWPSPSKKTRSPGSSWSRATGVPYEYWAAALCGSETPTCAYTNIVKPEQSKAPGPEAPQTYGVPRYCRAIPTTEVYWDGGGAGPWSGMKP